MKTQRIKKIATLSTLAAAMLIVTNAKATLTVNLANNGVGYIEPTFLGSHFTADVLDNMIEVYNGTLSSPIDSHDYTIYQGSSTPAAPLVVPMQLGSTVTPGTGSGVGGGYGSPTALINLGTGGYTYLTAQWDGPNGANVVYYIAGLSGIIELDNDLPGYFNTDQPKNKLGLSGYELTTPVPEPTTVIAGLLLLLPLGASTLKILRKKQMV